MYGHHRLSAMARLLIQLLARAGVTDMVASPGSRSTPYLSAALEHPGISVHRVVDERSAGFVALGLSRATRRPVALLCTSGTAAANYLPAIVEARLSEIPLIVLTADRPTLLQGCAASQTIDQVRLYGNHVLESVSLSVPSAEDELFALQRQILSALAKSERPEVGPVHLNLHTPKPLELRPPTDEENRLLERVLTFGARRARGELESSRSGPCVSEAAVGQLVSSVERHARGLIVCGYEPRASALDPLLLARFARASGYVVLLDAAHPLRLNAPDALGEHWVAPFEPLLRIPQWLRAAAPSLIVQIGRPMLSGAFERWLSTLASNERAFELLLLARGGWPDPSGYGQLLGPGDPNEVLGQALTQLESCPPRSSAWANQWARACDLVEHCVDTVADPRENAAEPWGELSAVRAVLDAVPEASRLIIGNSLAVREVDLLATRRYTGIRSEALRGASGIDGVVSTAAGFALAGQVGTTVLLGDVSFLHDIGGLWAASAVGSPLAIVVLNNGGGRIFEQLPVARAVSPQALANWTTPHRFDLAAAAAVYRIPHVRVSSRDALLHAMNQAQGRVGATVLEVELGGCSPSHEAEVLVSRIQRELLASGLIPEV